MAKRKTKKSKTKPKISRTRKSKPLNLNSDVEIKEKLKKVGDEFYIKTRALKEELTKSLNNPNADIVKNLLAQQSATLGLTVMGNNSQNKNTEVNIPQPDVNIPKLHRNKLEKMINELKSKKKKPLHLDSITTCSNAMNSTVLNYWQSPTTILRAVNDSISKRKWDNLIRLLLILIQHSQIYRPVIRHVIN